MLNRYMAETCFYSTDSPLRKHSLFCPHFLSCGSAFSRRAAGALELDKNILFVFALVPVFLLRKTKKFPGKTRRILNAGKKRRGKPAVPSATMQAWICGRGFCMKNWVRRLLLYLCGLTLVCAGIVLCKKCGMGISPVSSIPYVLSLAILNRLLEKTYIL